jgi:predicted amidophosphoribosyltransferase
MAGVTSLTRSLLDHVFPPRRAPSAIQQPPLPVHCGRPLLILRADQRCDLCVSGRGPTHLASLRAATVHDGAIRAAILAYKVRGMRRLAKPPGAILAEACQREDLTADLVTHNPPPSAGRRQHGYEQSRLSAREAAQRLSLPFLPDAAKRARATGPQTHLQGDQRVVNVAQALALASASMLERVKDRRVLPVDDVTATGSTLDASAAAHAAGSPSAIFANLRQSSAIFGLALSRLNGSAIS